MDRSRVEEMLQRFGVENYRWFDPAEIVVARWVRMKCMFGCGSFGRDATCPPNTPSVEACREFFAEYETAILLHFQTSLDDPEERHAYSREVNRMLADLEREVFLAGHRKTFLLPMDSCKLCDDCPGERVACKQPSIARPSPEAMAVDVFATVRNLGFPIEVLDSYDKVMNRYAILLVE